MTWNFKVYSRAYGNSRDQEQNFHLIKKNRGISMGLGFWSWNSRGETSFSPEFPMGKCDKPKNYMDFFRKNYVSTTGLDFFWNSTILKYKRVGDESRWDINLK